MSGKKIKSKTLWGYIVPAITLLIFGIFLYIKGSGGSIFVESDYKNSGYFTGGSGGDDLDIKRIRWHKHHGFERVVFDCYKYNGMFTNKQYLLTNETGFYEIGKDKKGSLELDGEIKGYRAFSADIPSFSKSKLINSIEVMPEDEGAFLFTIKLKKSTPYKAFYLTKPARIIIDLKIR